MPGRRLAGTADEVRTPAVRARIMPALARATGLPSFLAGVNPWADDDEAVLTALDFVPLIRVDADEGWLDAGADDPGGRAGSGARRPGPRRGARDRPGPARGCCGACLG